MRLTETPLPGAWVVEVDRIGDERGWFARTFDAELFAEHGLEPVVAQANASFNARRGTLRGMHLQAAPHGEPKLVRCTRGAIHDVAVDLRPDSPAYCRWHAVELSEESSRAFYLPPGSPTASRRSRTTARSCTSWAIGTYRTPPAACAGTTRPSASRWPEAPDGRTISERDLAYPDFAP